MLQTMPGLCLVCKSWSGQPVCKHCIVEFATPVHRCRHCALPLASPSAHICGTCTLHSPPLSTCLAAVDYAYPWSRLIQELKFRDHTGHARTLGQLLNTNPAIVDLAGAADWLLPLPLSAHRLRERGYNQAALLGRRLKGPQHHGLLLRIRHTDSQSSQTTAIQRHANMRNAFMANPTATKDLDGRHVVLVDDVMTTGATLQAAARALLEGGAARVSAIVVARTPH